MSEEERKAEKKKKKKKHKDGKKSKKDRSDQGEEGAELLEQRIKAKQDRRDSSSRASRRKSDGSSDEEERKPAARGGASASGASAAERRMGAENRKNGPEDEEIRRESARSQRESLKADDDDDDDADVVRADVDVYAPQIAADSEIMAEINQHGAVQIDEAGGIQAFVAETIEIDGDDVGIIKSDAEIESEEKRKYSKWFLGAVGGIILVVVIIAVPLTLKFAKGGLRTQMIVVTQSPTDVPSMMPSVEPSSMPTSERFMAIASKLYPLSGEALYDRGSPQYLAAMWMADRDPLNLDLDDAGFEQRYVLAVFYYAMDGPNWIEQNGWLSEQSECYWFAIEGTSPGCGSDDDGGCIPRTDFKGSYDKVCRMSFGRMNNLYGQIPAELSYLDEMRYFDVQTDYLFGTVPDSLGTNWTKLSAFLVGGNFLSGSFPNTFKDNAMLGTIFIGNNNFNGTFPEVFTTLKNLEWLEADNNLFAGSLPDSIGDLKNLRILSLNNNSLTGYIPDTWDADNLIEDLELADNKLKGPLPASLASTPFLKDLVLSRNELTGTIPVNYYTLETLEELYLDENKLGGELPQTQEPFYNGLQELSLHSNEFEGRFPVEWMESTFRIKVIQLHRNQLTGTLSTSNICDRLDPARSYTKLINLTADCDKMTCDCCTTCYVNGEAVSSGQ